MKKYLLFLFIICLSLSLCACAKESTDPLAYQSYPFYVEGTLTFDETDYDFSLSMESESSSTITFSSPDSLRDFVFRITPEGTTLSYEDMTIDFNKADKSALIRLIPSLFALKIENLKSSTEDTVSSVPVLVSTFSTQTGDVVVYLNRDTLLPLRFEGKDFVVNIFTFTHAKAPESATPVPDQA